MPKRIEYKKWEEVGPYKCLYIEERPKKKSSARRALFLCGKCGIRTFEAQINVVKCGRQKSCGCAKSDYKPSRVKDLTGKKFGRLTVIEQVPHKIGENSKWRCLCECGNETIVDSAHLSGRENYTKSCGCLKKEKAGNYQTKDLTGKRFGFLTVLKRNGVKKYNDGGTTSLWTCKCDCGKEKDIPYHPLVGGLTISCGCKKVSKGELKIKTILEKLNISFEREYKIENNQRFDFYLPDYNCCIEYQGEQHYRVVDYFGGEEDFQKRQERDFRKKEYCQKNNIKFLEIKYTDFDKLNVDYISNLLKNG